MREEIMGRHHLFWLRPEWAASCDFVDRSKFFSSLPGDPAPGDTSATKLSLEIAKNGRTVGQLSYDLPAADQNGRIQYASAIQLDKFQPGDYDLRVSVQNANRRATSSTPFTISP